MGQEFHVVRCFSCLTFQSQQVRKDKKFACKLCGAKQSVKKNYGKGTGKDCRVHVQKLNSLRGNLEREQEKSLESQLEYEEDAESPSGVLSCSPRTFSAACYSDSQLGDRCYVDSEEEKKSNRGEASLASNSVCPSGSKWSNYITSEADDSDDNLMEGPTSNASSRISHVTNEAVDDELDHESLQVIQKKNLQQKNLPKGPMRSQSKKTEHLGQSKWCSGPYPGSSVGLTGQRSAVSEKSYERSSLNEKEYIRQGFLKNKFMKLNEEKSQSTNQENSIPSRKLSSSLSESCLQRKRQIKTTNDLSINSEDLNKRATNSKLLNNTAIFGNNRKNPNPECSKRQITYTLSSHKLPENPGSSHIDEAKGILKYGKSRDRILKESSFTNYPIQEASFEVQKDKSSNIDNQSSPQDTLVIEEQNPIDATNHVLKKKRTNKLPTNVATPITVKEKSFAPYLILENHGNLELSRTSTGNTGKHLATNRITPKSKDSISILPQIHPQRSDILFVGSNTIQGKFDAAAAYRKYEAAEDLEEMINFSL